MKKDALRVVLAVMVAVMTGCGITRSQPDQPPPGNAADLYMKAFEGPPEKAWWREFSRVIKFGSLYYSSDAAHLEHAPGPPFDESEAWRELERHGRVLKLLRLAADLPYCRFPKVTYGPGRYEVAIPHVPQLNMASQVLTGATVLAARNGRHEEALDHLLASIGLINSLDEEPYPVSQLVRYSWVQAGFAVLKVSEIKASREQWSELQRAIETIDLRFGFVARMLWQRGDSYAKIADLLSGGILPEELASLLGHCHCGCEFNTGVPVERFDTPEEQRRLAQAVLKLGEGWLSLYERPFHEVRRAQEDLTEEIRNDPDGTVAHLMMVGSHAALAAAQTRLVLMSLYCRIRAGDIPKTFHGLDPLTGTFLRYDRSPDAVRVWSPGLNLEDEDGEGDDIGITVRLRP